jgi:hypothetical protein
MIVFHEVPGYTFAQFIAEKLEESTVYTVAAVPAEGVHFDDLAHMVIRRLFKVQPDGSKISDSRPLAKIYLNNAVLIIDIEIFLGLEPLAKEYEARHDSRVLLIRPLPPMINKVT